ncbi:MAG: SDR family oxidoreductase [Opitutae bacterium]|nr:SDR family oxidoreductase [Opitutae bacterium]
MARAFAQEGAHVLLSGRRLATVEPSAAALREMGGRAEAAEVDAGDEAATENYVARLAAAGGVDVFFNAIGLPAGVKSPGLSSRASRPRRRI